MWGSCKVGKKRKETQASGKSQKNPRPRKKSPRLPDFWSETAEGKTGVQDRSLGNPKKPGLHAVSYDGQRHKLQDSAGKEVWYFRGAARQKMMLVQNGHI